MGPDIPLELILTIVQKVVDKNTFVALCLTTQAVYKEASRCLYCDLTDNLDVNADQHLINKSNRNSSFGIPTYPFLSVRTPSNRSPRVGDPLQRTCIFPEYHLSRWRDWAYLQISGISSGFRLSISCPTWSISAIERYMGRHQLIGCYQTSNSN